MKCFIHTTAGIAAMTMAFSAAAGCSSHSDQNRPDAAPSVPAYTEQAEDQASGPVGSAGPSAGLTWAPEDVTPQGLSNPDTEYTVEGLPDDLDETGKEIVAGYVAYDQATWDASRVMDGDLSRVEASTTGEALESYNRTYESDQANGWHHEGQYSMTVQGVSVTDASSGEASMLVCGNARQERIVTADGQDTGQDIQHTYTRAVTLQMASGAWVVASSNKIGVDQC